MDTSSGQKFLNTSPGTKSRVLQKNRPSLVTNWTPSAPNSASLSDIGVSDVQKIMPENGLVWAYECLKSYVMEIIYNGDTTWDYKHTQGSTGVTMRKD